jgi:hypothetical protein
MQLVRAGELIAGSGAANPILGWYSPTYGVKVPALSYSLTLQSGLPCLLTSEWRAALDVQAELTMHILLIHQAFASLDEPGGTRHHELARYLAARGHRVTVITSPVSYLTGTSPAGSMANEAIGVYEEQRELPSGGSTPMLPCTAAFSTG